jgi:hypothetical protein
MGERLFYVDAFRGTAILLMIFLNVFDYVSVYDVHVNPPFYVEQLNSVTVIPPILLFGFVSGMSAYLITKKYKKKKFLEFLKTLIIKYGKYFLISIPFTLFMWGFNTFYAWEEAIQGLSVSAIIASVIIYYTKSKRHLLNIALILFILQSVLLYYYRVEGWTINSGYFLGFFLNMLFRGWFSILNLVPLMLAGAFFFRNYKNNRGGMNLVISLVSGLVFYSLSGFVPVDYYSRSLNLFFYFTCVCGLITYSIYYLYSKGLRLTILKTYGLLSFEIYIIHFVLAKSIRLLGFGDLLGLVPAVITTILISVLFYISAKYYVKVFKPRLV